MWKTNPSEIGSRFWHWVKRPRVNEARPICLLVKWSPTVSWGEKKNTTYVSIIPHITLPHTHLHMCMHIQMHGCPHDVMLLWLRKLNVLIDFLIRKNSRNLPWIDRHFTYLLKSRPQRTNNHSHHSSFFRDVSTHVHSRTHTHTHTHTRIHTHVYTPWRCWIYYSPNTQGIQGIISISCYNFWRQTHVMELIFCIGCDNKINT